MLDINIKEYILIKTEDNIYFFLVKLSNEIKYFSTNKE